MSGCPVAGCGRCVIRWLLTCRCGRSSARCCVVGRLVVVPEAVAGSPEDLHALLVAQQVSVLTQTPSAVAMLLGSEGLESAALVVVGEACPPEVVERWAPGRVMVNAYGPTETTMCVAISAPLRRGYRAGNSADRVPGGRGGVVRPGRVVASGAGRVWSVSCMWPVRVSASATWAAPR